jgi:fatty-acyl-CoA synthase
MSDGSFQPGQCYDYPLIIKKLLTTGLRGRPDLEIVYRDQIRLSYDQLATRVHRLAGALKKLGVQKGDTVAVLDWDSHRYLECYFAIPMMGAVLQTVNWRLAPEQIAYTLNHAEAKIVLVNSDFLPIWKAVGSDVTSVDTVVLLKEDGRPMASEVELQVEYESILKQAPAHFDFEDLDENTRATTFYTTGTTGNPKGVHFTHRQLVLHTLGVAVSAGCYAELGGLRSNDVYMPLTPMFHVHAWGFPYIATMLGTKQVYPGKYEPDFLVELIVREKVTFSHCVPTIMQMILNSPLAAEADFSRWKVNIGGAPMPRGLARAALNMGIDIVSGYGMSETCPVVSVARPKTSMVPMEEELYLDTITKTGLPLPLVELEVVDGEDNILPHDGVSTGEVVMRAPWLTRSYFKAPDKTKELWRNGWLHSGDVGYIDPQGYLKITDRIKDVIKSGGEWISSLDLENILSQHEAVLESAAVGVPDPKWGERPLMLVTLKIEMKGKIDEGDLRKHMITAVEDGRLPTYAVPDRYIIVDDIPKTSVGKLDKKAIRQRFSES